MKKKLSLLLVVLMVSTTLSGCINQNMTDLYKLSKDINKINVAEITGEFKLTSAESMDGMNSVKVLYKTKQDKKAQKYNAIIDLQIDNEPITRLTEITLDKGFVYTKTDDLIKFAEKFEGKYGITSESITELKEMMGTDKYAKVDVGDDYAEFIELGTNGEYGELLDVFFELVNESINKTIKEFKFDALTKVGNKYTLELDVNTLIKTVADGSTYLLDNREGIEEIFVQTVDKLPQETFNKLVQSAGEEVTKAEIIDSIKESSKEIKENEQQYREEIAELIAESHQYDSEFSGTKATITLEKTADNSYKTETSLVIKYEGQLDISVTNTSILKPVSSVNIVVPTVGVRDITDKINGKLTQDEYKVLEIYTKEGYYEYDSSYNYESGQIDVIIEDGRTYLPLRKVGEMLGEDVQWDNSTKTAYINQNGQRIKMGGLLRDSKAFVKVRDFEKLGYTVDWDDTTKVASIIK